VIQDRCHSPPQGVGRHPRDAGITQILLRRRPTLFVVYGVGAEGEQVDKRFVGGRDQGLTEGLRACCQLPALGQLDGGLNAEASLRIVARLKYQLLPRARCIRLGLRTRSKCRGRR
jgi:hypothetical protein